MDIVLLKNGVKCAVFKISDVLKKFKCKKLFYEEPGKTLEV